MLTASETAFCKEMAPSPVLQESSSVNIPGSKLTAYAPVQESNTPLLDRSILITLTSFIENADSAINRPVTFQELSSQQHFDLRPSNTN